MTSTTVTDVPTLTADDVAALRVATSVCFHRNDGRSYIRAYLRPPSDPPVFSRRQQLLFPGTEAMPGERHREIATTNGMYGYTDTDGTWRVDSDDRTPSAFYMIHSARYNATWPTIASLLSAGEVLHLAWIADNNTDNIHEAGLHADELDLVTTKGNRKRTFSVGYQVCPDNSARMIRRHG